MKYAMLLSVLICMPAMATVTSDERVCDEIPNLRFAPNEVVIIDRRAYQCLYKSKEEGYRLKPVQILITKSP